MTYRSSTRTVFSFLILLLPVFGMAQTANVLSAHRVFPKMDKRAEFEKAMVAHVQKYHTAKNRWRVFAIQSGPDAGGYHITEGPTTWEGLDNRGDLGAEHTADWDRSVAIYLSDRQSASYAVYQDSLSTIAVGDYTDHINISHVYPKVGRGDDVAAMIRKLRKGWQASGITVAVYMASSSGPAQYTLVTRYKQGLKERDPGFRKPFREVYEAVNGAGSYNQYFKDAAEFVQDSWSELLSLRKDLSSK